MRERPLHNQRWLYGRTGSSWGVGRVLWGWWVLSAALSDAPPAGSIVAITVTVIVVVVLVFGAAAYLKIR